MIEAQADTDAYYLEYASMRSLELLSTIQSWEPLRLKSSDVSDQSENLQVSLYDESQEFVSEQSWQS